MHASLRYLFCCFFVCLCTFAQGKRYEPDNVPDPKTAGNDYYVSNPDGIISQTEVADLNAMCRALEGLTDVQLGIAVIDDIGTWDDFDFGVALFRRWGLGHKDKMDGVLFLYVETGHKIRINVGSGIEDVLTDALCSYIYRNEMIPCFKEGRVGHGLLCGAAHLLELFSDGDTRTGALRQALLDGTYATGAMSEGTSMGKPSDDHVATGLMADGSSSKTGSQESAIAGPSQDDGGGEEDGKSEHWEPGDFLSWVLFIIFGLCCPLLFLYFVWDTLTMKTKSYEDVRDIRQGCGCVFVPLLGLFAWLIHPAFLVVIAIWWLATFFYRCPQCGKYGCRVKNKKTIKKPSIRTEGEREVTWKCRCCGEFVRKEPIGKEPDTSDVHFPVLSYLFSSRSSRRRGGDGGSDSGSRGGSWGGGGTSGGGAGGSW